MKADKNKHDKNEENQENITTPSDEIEIPGEIPDCEQSELIDQVEEPIDEDNKLLSELEAERERYVRLYAEYENFRKRSKKERDTVFSEVRADTVLKFLPIYDNLERALAQESSDEAYKKGVELILLQMKETLNRLGVAEIPSVGARFDPELHNAVMHVEDPDKEEGEIVEEFEKGFILGDKVIRFSMVKVAN